MARREVIPENDPEHFDDILSGDDARDLSEVKLDSVLTEIGGTDAEIKIYRADKPDGRECSYLFTQSADDADLTRIQDILRDEYGGGKFRVQVRRGGLLLANRALSVEAPKRAPNKERESGGIADMLAAIQESTRQQMDMMREQMYRQQQETMRYQLESAKQQTELMARLFESGRQQSAGPDILEVMLKAKELIAPPAKTDNMDVFLRGLEMGRDLGGNDDALTTAIRTFGGTVGDVVARASQTPPAPVTLPAPPGIPRQPQTPPPGETDMNLLQLLPYVNQLLRGAASGSDPNAYAVIVMDTVPEAVLRAWIVPDEAYNKLVAHPSAAPYKAWLDAVRADVLLYLSDLELTPDNDGTDAVPTGEPTGGAGGDSDDAGKNAVLGGPVQGQSGGARTGG
ncbi:MAG: hypothetical protein WC130_10610 [Kiritimatiellia bacterium]